MGCPLCAEKLNNHYIKLLHCYIKSVVGNRENKETQTWIYIYIYIFPHTRATHFLSKSLTKMLLDSQFT